MKGYNFIQRMDFFNLKYETSVTKEGNVERERERERERSVCTLSASSGLVLF